MKKIYMKPAVQVVELNHQEAILNSSAKRSAGYQVDGLGEGTDKFFDFDDDDFGDTEYDR